MAKPNYAFAKRQRELAKKQKKEEKRKRKAEAAADEALANPAAPGEDSATPPSPPVSPS